MIHGKKIQVLETILIYIFMQALSSSEGDLSFWKTYIIYNKKNIYHLRHRKCCFSLVTLQLTNPFKAWSPTIGWPSPDLRTPGGAWLRTFLSRRLIAPVPSIPRCSFTSLILTNLSNWNFILHILLNWKRLSFLLFLTR